MKEEPKRILQVLIGGPTFTGVSSYLHQQYTHIDRERIQFDFLFCFENSMKIVMDDPVLRDSSFYTLNAKWRNTRSADYFKITRGLEKALSTRHYDAVVVNTSIVAVSMACMRAVEKHPETKFIAHAHNTGLVLGKNALRQKLAPIVRIVENAFRARIRKKAYALFACSEEAGRSTFGEQAVSMEKFMLVHDAIDVSKFRFDPKLRDEVRREASIGGRTFVCGNVGKLSKRKNQPFLIQAFAEIHHHNPDSQLWLIGDGKYKEEQVELVRKLGLEEAVVFWGQKQDVFRYLQGMDVFAFPTLSEGLGIVAIEAQAAGLPTIVSDGVPDDVLITPLAKKLQLAEGSTVWAEEIESLCASFPERSDFTEAIKAAGYDLAAEAARMTEFYSALNRE